MQRKIPLLPLTALLMELTALAFIALVLVSPAPFEHCSISLLTVGPPPANIVATSLPSPTSAAVPPEANSSSSSVAPPSSLSNASSVAAPLSIASTDSDHDEASASRTTGHSADVAAAASQAGISSSPTPDGGKSPSVAPSTSPSAPAPTTGPPSFAKRNTSMLVGREALPLSAQSPRNMEVLNGTVATAGQVEQQAKTMLLLRIGPLGDCFRTADGKVETCSPALLHPKYDYRRLGQALAAAMGSAEGRNSSTTKSSDASLASSSSSSSSSSDSGASTTAAPTSAANSTADAEPDPSAAVAALPTSMTAYPTVLLLVVICVACIAGLWCAQAILMLRSLRASAHAGEAVHLTPAWAAAARFTGMASVITTAMLLIMTGVEKYTLSQAKNAFNSAQPMAPAPLAPDEDGPRSSKSRASTTESVSLVAETGNAFGFLWIACVLLLMSYWLRRTWVRRQRAQALTAATTRYQRESESESGDSGGKNLEESCAPLSILMAQPKTRSKSQAQPLRAPSAAATVDSDCERFGYGSRSESGGARSYRPKKSLLPSLHTAHTGLGDGGDASTASPSPFSMYEPVQGPEEVLCSCTREKESESAHRDDGVCSQYNPRRHAGSNHGQTLACCEQQSTTYPPPRRPFISASASSSPSHGGPMPLASRSASPAPSYHWTPDDRERERRYMADVRRKREAEAESAAATTTTAIEYGPASAESHDPRF